MPNFNFQAPTFSAPSGSRSSSAPSAPKSPFTAPPAPPSFAGSNTASLGTPTSTSQNAYTGQLGTLAGETAGQSVSLAQYAGTAGPTETNAFLNAINSIVSTDPTARFAAVAPEVQDINSQFKQSAAEIAANTPRGGDQDYLQSLNEMQRSSNISNMLNQEYNQAINEQGQIGSQLIGQAYQGFGVAQSGAAVGGNLTEASAGMGAAATQSNLNNIASILSDAYSGSGIAGNIEKLIKGSPTASSPGSSPSGGFNDQLINSIMNGPSTGASALPAGVDAVGNASSPIATLPTEASLAVAALPGVTAGLSSAAPIAGDLAAVGGDAAAPIAALPMGTSAASAISAMSAPAAEAGGTAATTSGGLTGALSSLGGDIGGAAGNVGSAFGAASSALGGLGAELGTDLGSATLSTVLGAVGTALPFLAPLALIPLLFHGANPNEQTAATAHQAFDVAGSDVINAVKAGYITPAQGQQIMSALIPSGQQQVGSVVSGIQNTNSKIQGTVPQLTNELTNDLNYVEGMPAGAATPFSAGGVESTFINPSTPGYMSSAVTQGNTLALQAIQNLLSSAYASA